MEIWLVLLGAALVWFIIDLVRVQDIWARLPQHEQDKLMVGRSMNEGNREFLQRRFYFPTSSRRFLLAVVLLLTIGAISKLLGSQGS